MPNRRVNCRFFRTLIDALVLTAMSFVNAAAFADAPPDVMAGFDEYARAALADLKTPGLAVAVVRNGQVILTRGYGVHEVGKDERVDAHTIFPIASVTKVFTATCLAQFVEAEKLKWTDPVVKHLPEFQLGNDYLTRETTLVDLLSHRTGLERGDLLAYRGDYDRPELLRRLRYLQPLTPFRDRYGYHNLMVVTAGELLERVSGERWSDLMTSRIFQPLGMKRTVSGPQELHDLANVAKPHVIADGVAKSDPAWRRDAEHEGFQRLHAAVAPAGAIQSNVADLARFVQLYLGEGEIDGRRLLKTATVREMFAAHSVLPIKPPADPNFAYPQFFVGCGLGWHLRDFRGRRIVYHGGSSGAVVAMMPDERLGVVVLANLGNGVVYMMMHDLFDRLLGIPRTWTNRDWVREAIDAPAESAAAKNAGWEMQRAKGTNAALPLTAYAGTFASELYGHLEISQQNGTLHLQFGPNMHATLHHWEHDTFRTKLSFPADDEWFVKFVVADGRTNRIEIERLWWHEPMPPFIRQPSDRDSK